MKAIRKAKVTYAILFLAALVLFLAVKPGTVTYAASKKNGLKNYKTITVEKSQNIVAQLSRQKSKIFIMN